MNSLSVDQPLNEARAILGEGPVWHEGRLYWVDIEGGKILTHDPVAGAAHDLEIDLPDRVGFAWPCEGSPKWICGQPDGLYFVDLETGALESAVAVEADQPRTRFNDGKTDPQGRLWAGTMDMEEREPLGTLYQFGAELIPIARHGAVTVSNGLAWAPDGCTLYYIDSPTREVRAFDFDPASGAIANTRVAVRFAEGEGFPDGMAIDTEGMLWVALWEGWRVVRCDPASGEQIGEIRVPAAKATSCAFAGEGMEDLYITTARIGLSEEELAAQPFAGGLFKAEPGVTGEPPVPFAVA
jgi:sugar lactone lactonase YvrE